MRPDCEAAERNKGPIAELLERWVPTAGLMLELASGSGQHVEHFCRAFPHLTWQPSDPDPEARAAILERRDRRALGNVLAPLDLDVRERPWPIDQAAGLVCVNMLHVAPWDACEALFAGAGEVLGSGAPCIVYGPFRVEGGFNSEGNAAFDARLRERDPRLGLRDVAAVAGVADAAGFELAEQAPMPANNFTLIFVRR